jgi:signal transduction histidine kinase
MSQAVDLSTNGSGTWPDQSTLEPELWMREQRLQLARELHDVVASGFSVVSLQASLAEHLLAERPERALEALAQIRQTSTDALDELRTILGILRTAEPGAAGGAPGVARVPTLASTLTAAGVPTRLSVAGRQRLLPADVDLAAYRIVQEALTNVVRHAGATGVSILLAYEDVRLVVEVEDNGAGGDGPSSHGHGILGMRERSAALGGEFEAGPCAAGGFRVRATLPLRPRR